MRLVSLFTRLDSRPTRFLLVGVSGMGVNSAVLLLGVQVFRLSVPIGGVLAGATSIFTNFLLNDVFTWRDRRPPGMRMKLKRLGRYYGTTIAGSLLYLVVLAVLVKWFGILLLLANILAMGLGGAFNYLLHNLWTWRK